VEVVGVDHARPRAAHGRGDVVGCQTAAQQAGRGACAAEQRRVALEQLDLAAQVLGHQPAQVGHGPLLAAGRAVAVVQEQDHREGKGFVSE
jgi:hypothetical protein